MSFASAVALITGPENKSPIFWSLKVLKWGAKFLPRVWMLHRALADAVGHRAQTKFLDEGKNFHSQTRGTLVTTNDVTAALMRRLGESDCSRSFRLSLVRREGLESNHGWRGK